MTHTGTAVFLSNSISCTWTSQPRFLLWLRFSTLLRLHVLPCFLPRTDGRIRNSEQWFFEGLYRVIIWRSLLPFVYTSSEIALSGDEGHLCRYIWLDRIPEVLGRRLFWQRSTLRVNINLRSSSFFAYVYIVLLSCRSAFCVSWMINLLSEQFDGNFHVWLVTYQVISVE